mmetsp:Transcript_12949/g.15351  ORF Transcript_12949/g.15351 Transcript_12949/m.15351 type:complete len:89 (-) Transcript_12949:75-341(-)
MKLYFTGGGEEDKAAFKLSSTLHRPVNPSANPLHARGTRRSCCKSRRDKLRHEEPGGGAMSAAATTSGNNFSLFRSIIFSRQMELNTR